MSPHGTRRRSPDATVARLAMYLQFLTDQLEREVANISSDELASLAAVNAAKVRKDLSYMGSYGTRGVGYDVEYLVYQIRRELGLDHEWSIVILGAGHLGQALTGYGGFSERGYSIEGIFDIDDQKVDVTVGGVRVRHLDELPQIVAQRSVSIGVIATPADSAQDAADRLVKSGVTSILNFAPVVVNVPLGISVRRVDLSVELQILSYHEQRRLTAAAQLRAVTGDSLGNATA